MLWPGHLLDTRAFPGQWLCPAFSSWVLLCPSSQLLREASRPPRTAQSPPSLALMDPLPFPCSIYTSVCFFSRNTLGVFFPSPAFSKANKKNCLCLNYAYCVNQPQNIKPLVAAKMAWWAERGGTILGFCPSFTTTSLQVRCVWREPGGRLLILSLCWWASSHPATIPRRRYWWGSWWTDALPGGCELLRESCQLRFSQLQQAIIFCMIRSSLIIRGRWHYFSRGCVFPVFCFVSHWIRYGSPLVAICRKISWAGERCLVGVRSLSSSHFFPLPPQAISNYFIRH